MFFNPFYTFSLIPFSLSSLTIFKSNDSYSMLLAILPLAIELSAIRHIENTFSFLLAVHKLSLIYFFLIIYWLSIFTESMHLIIFPATLIFASILPFVCSFSVYFSIFPFTYIFSSFCRFILSFAVLITVHVLSYILRTIGPGFCSLSVLFAIFPLA